jgi:glycolate oxidase iron-sulfur subunit
VVGNAAVDTIDPPTPEPHARISDELLAACVHCGFCVPVCPTWDLLREENDSPRGRLYLMRAEADGRVDPAGAFAVHLDRCLGCRACETVCPAGVPYGHLLEKARSRIVRRPPVQRRARWTLTLLTDARVAPALYTAARWLRVSRIAGALGRVLPGIPGRLLRLLAATRPALRFDRDGPQETPLPVEEPDHARAYGLLRGCVMEGLFEHVHAATRRTLARIGYREIPAPDQVCCGALHAHAGDLDEARRLARENIEAFERAFETAPDGLLVTNSAGCGAGLRDYPGWFDGEPEWRERAEALADRVRDVTEIVAADLTSSGEARARAPGIEAADLEGRVAYDAPCHLHHGQGVIDEPLEVLRSVPGLSVEPLPSSDRCCGGAGLYNLTQPELAERVRAPKLAELLDGGFDWLATGNPGCIMYLGAGLIEIGSRTPVVHPIELLDRAWR